MKATISKIPKTILAGSALALLVIAGVIGYSFFAFQPEAAEEENTLQTTLVRRGDLIISASGTGVLSVSDKVELSFTASGDVLGVYVKAGDSVKAGDLLAEIDDSEMQAEYANAKRTYMELTSPGAIASALDSFAQAQKSYSDAVYQLEYLISPDVMYWEQKIAEAEQALEVAKSQASANSSDGQARKQAEETEAYLNYAVGMLNEARILYDNEYAFENFVRRDSEGHHYLALPSEMDVHQARLAMESANVALAEARVFYEALNSSVIPEGTNIPGLLEIQKAKHELEDAQARLDGAKIIAPIDGMVMSVDIALGDQSDTGTAITLADLSRPYLDIYMDESDWEKTVAGNKVEIVFDALSNLTFTGEIDTVDSELYSSGTSNTVHGTVLLDASFDRINLPIGAAASVEIISAGTKNALLIPIEALRKTDSGEYSVYIVTAEGLRLQIIEIGIQNELYAEAKSGLNEDDTVAIGIVEVE